MAPNGNTSSATTAVPVPRDADADLLARWLEEVPGSGTRRDQALQALRAGNGRGMDLRGIHLIGEDLRGADLAGCDLTETDLSEADLSGAAMTQCKLQRAVLFKTRLDAAELLGADLTAANLGECSAVRAGFGHADLSGATLFGADLTGATLSNAKLCGADLRAATLEGARLRDANLAKASFTRARMGKADLGKSDVSGADFGNADLREARLRALHGFEDATWLGADVRSVDFTGAYLLRRFIMDENYLFEFRTRGRYAQIVYNVWWLTSDCGRSPLRWFFWNLVVAVGFGMLYLLVDVDYGDHRTAFSPFYYSIVTLTTLGYGDVVPASSAAQVLATLEVFLGYVGLGGLLSILASKMARRAD